MLLHAKTGEELKLVRIYSQVSHLGIMTGETEVVNEYLLGDIKNNFIPEKWQSYSYFTPLLDQYQNNFSLPLPEVVSIGLFLVSGGDSKLNNVPFVVVWFQDSFFSHPPENVIMSIEEYKLSKLINNSYF